VFALLRLHELTGSTVYRERAEYVIRTFEGAADRNAFGFAHLLAAVDFARCGPFTIIFAGQWPGAAPLAQAIHRAYVPGARTGAGRARAGR